MPMFNDCDEVYRYLGGLFEHALADDALATSAAASGVVARFRLVDPQSEFVIDLPGRRVLMGAAGSDVVTAVELEMKADAAHALWLGRVQPAVLIATRRVRVRGSVRKLLRMQSLGEQLIPVYEQLLRAAHREDLLDVPVPAET
jgi:SCP-2 sterol transfer family